LGIHSLPALEPLKIKGISKIKGQLAINNKCKLYAVYFLCPKKGGGVMHPTGWDDAPVIDPLQRPFAFIYSPVNFS
jgi:hypothetical protein